MFSPNWPLIDQKWKFSFLSYRKTESQASLSLVTFDGESDADSLEAQKPYLDPPIDP